MKRLYVDQQQVAMDLVGALGGLRRHLEMTPCYCSLSILGLEGVRYGAKMRRSAI
jgi:hypothetical protein